LPDREKECEEMRVIARAYKDKPLDRIVVGEGERVIYIANPSTVVSTGKDGTEGVGFPKNCVFEFDSALLDSLNAAWASGDRDQLERLWSAAKPAKMAAHA